MTEEFTFILLLSYVVLIVMNAMIAKQKRRSIGNTVVVSIFFSPIVCYLYLLAVPSISIEDKEKLKEKTSWYKKKL